MSPIAGTVALPHAELPDADWADRYMLVLTGPRLTAVDLTKRILEHPPRWIDGLMRLRNAAMAPFGLRGAAGKTAPVANGIGGFPVVSATDEQVVLGFNDKHLNFRIVIDVTDHARGQVASVTTLVHRHNLGGRLYLAAIMPFHKLIVRTMLGQAGRPAD